jgi:hypothetical protein
VLSVTTKNERTLRDLELMAEEAKRDRKPHTEKVLRSAIKELKK